MKGRREAEGARREALDAFASHLWLANDALSLAGWRLAQHRATERDGTTLPVHLIAAHKWLRAARTNVALAKRAVRRAAR